MNSLTEIGTGCFQYSNSLTGNDVAPPIPGVFSPSQCQFLCQVWASLSYRWQHKSNIDSLSQFFLSATNLHYVYFSLWHCQQSIFRTYIKIGILYLSMQISSCKISKIHHRFSLPQTQITALMPEIKLVVSIFETYFFHVTRIQHDD